MSQLSKLATPFPEKFIENKPGKFAAAYVPHGIITQFLLGMLGPYDFSIDTNYVTMKNDGLDGSTQTSKRSLRAE